MRASRDIMGATFGRLRQTSWFGWASAASIILLLTVGQLDFLRRYSALDHTVADLELASSLLEATWATQAAAKTARYSPSGSAAAYELSDEIDANLKQALSSWTIICGQCPDGDSVHGMVSAKSMRLQLARDHFLDLLQNFERGAAASPEIDRAFEALIADAELTHLVLSRERRQLQASVMAGRRAIQADLVVVGSGTVLGSILLLLLFVRSRHRSEAIASQRAAELEAAAKTRLLTTVSHELRTPLTGILGLCEELDLEQFDRSERRSTIGAIEEHGQQLLAMVDGLLLLQQRGQERIASVRSPFESSALERSLITPFQAKLCDRPLSLALRGSSDLPPMLVFDHEHTMAALLRLVENAVRFTERGSIDLEVSHIITPPGDGAESGILHFRLQDTGPGLPPAQREQLFELFSQADGGLTRSHEGLGIGLPIASALIAAAEGQLRLIRSDREGTCFEIEVPCAVGEATSPAPAEENTPQKPEAKTLPPLRNSRVLIAEDNAINRRILERMLRSIAEEIHSVENGQLAVDAVQEARSKGMPYDLVVMDMQMPVMDGYEATRRISEIAAELPVLACTAHANPGDRERCLDAGCDEYVTKPIARPSFEAAVRSLISAA